jgi:hypothetical protein
MFKNLGKIKSALEWGSLLFEKKMWVFILSIILSVLSFLKGYLELFSQYVGWPIAIIATTLGLFIMSCHAIAGFLKIGSIIKKKLGMQKHCNAEQRPVSVTSYNQSGGITANSVSVGSYQRYLTEEIKKQLLEQIDNKKPLDIVCSMNDPEAERYSFMPYR